MALLIIASQTISEDFISQVKTTFSPLPSSSILTSFKILSFFLQTVKKSKRYIYPMSKENSSAADAEAASSSTKDEIIRGLNEDLAREYKAIIQYVVYSSTLKGAEYSDIAEQLKQHASQELSHAMEVAKQIDYLGGDPTVKGKDAEYSPDSKTMLEFDLRAEQETIKNYRERIRQAERAGEFALSETLREIIVQEQDHEIDLKDALGLR
jgi:bacterioferritin